MSVAVFFYGAVPLLILVISEVQEPRRGSEGSSTPLNYLSN